MACSRPNDSPQFVSVRGAHEKRHERTSSEADVLRISSSPRLLRSINILLGRSEGSLGVQVGTATAAISSQGEARADSTKMAEVSGAVSEDLDLSPSSTSLNSAVPLITMRLHPGDVKFLLDSAPSEDVRGAWQSGNAWSTGQRRLLLIENEPPFSTVSWAVGNFATNLVYEDGRKWWLKHGGLHEEV